MKEFIKWSIVVLLALLAAHFYAQYKLASVAATNALISMRQSNDFINNQCVTLLGRQGFQVTKTPPPVEEPEKEEVEEEK